MPLENGAALGPYVISGKIGEGGMGAVYRAKDTRIGREVAIKVLPEEIANDPERLGRFEHEARAAGMLNHPNLLTIFDVGSEDGAPYMVSELLVGSTLREIFDRGPVPQKKALNYTLQIAKGLGAAHEKGLIHRDLKPENIFVNAEGLVKILDFGLAKLNPMFARENGQTDGVATEPGMVLGTVGYMSPEQVRGKPLDQRSDIFSLGTILWEMGAGRRAFTGESSVETLSAILREEPPDLTSVNPNVSPVFEKIVQRCLEKNTQQRFQSARDLAFQIETLQTQHTGGSTASPFMTGETPTTRIPSVEKPLPTEVSTAHPHRSAVRPAPTGAAPHGTASSPRPGTAATRAPVAPPTRPGTTPVPRTTMSGAPRPQMRPVKRTSPWQVAVAGLLVLALGALGGYLYRQRLEQSSVPTFQRMTFRRGEVLAARFAQDGETIVYSAAWDGRRDPELFVMRSTSPESRAFGIPRGEVASISSSGEVAVLLDYNRDTRLGRLARVPLMGGQPREVMEDVHDADWLPGGNDLGVIRKSGTEYILEVPIGNVLHRSARRISLVRISPDGERIAFMQLNRGQFEIVMLEAGEFEVLTTGWKAGISGLAWSADGRELWFTAAGGGSEPPSLFALAPGNEHRLVSRLTGALRIHDIAPNGKVLMTHSNWRSSLTYAKLVAGEIPEPVVAKPEDGAAEQVSEALPEEVADPEPVVVETELSWLDWSVLAGMSADGTKIVLSETREGGGDAGSVYLRDSNGSAPIRLGTGWADDLSPDGEWVLAHASRTSLVRMPTGTGEPEILKTIAAIGDGARFFPDGNKILVPGAQPGGGFGLFKQDLTTGDIVPITPEGIWSPPYPAWVISPDGRWIAAPDATRRLTLYQASGSRSRPIPEAKPEEIPIQWSADGVSIYVATPGEIPLRIWRIDLRNGARVLWRTIAPKDPAGVYRISPVVISRGGGFWAYNTLRTLSDLYIADGLE